MQKRIRGISIGIVLSILALASLSGCSAGSATPAPTPNVQIKASALNTVSAEATVVPAQQAKLAFKTGGRIVEVLVTEGDIVKAGAVLARLDDTTLKAQVAQAQAARTVAEKQLAQLSTGATPAQRRAAQEALTSARATLARVQAGPTADQLAQLKANLDNAQAAVAQAQFRYDRIGGDSNPFGTAAPERLVLQQASNALAAMQAAYRESLDHPTHSELEAAQLAVTQAESAIAGLDPTAEQLSLAEAQVAQAQAAADLAQAALPDAVLTAPFDGSIVTTSIDAGEVVSPGTPAFTFANLSKLQIETTDLAEVDVARVAVGQKVNIKLDAFPGKSFTGEVARIAQAANEHSGDKVFKVTIDVPEGASAGFRWGMTASVEIATTQNF